MMPWSFSVNTQQITGKCQDLGLIAFSHCLMAEQESLEEKWNKNSSLSYLLVASLYYARAVIWNLINCEIVLWNVICQT